MRPGEGERRVCTGLWLRASLAVLFLGACSGGSTNRDYVAPPSTTINPLDRAIQAGNVALCNDGGYSDNTDLGDTCSGGGGVDEWLATYGECNDGRIIVMGEDVTCRDNDGFRALKAADFKPTAGPDDLALCNDGTYSDNTDLGDTCNSAGEVDEWLATYGECNDGRIIVMGNDTCRDNDGFKRLMPTDYELPTTTTTITTTTTSVPAEVPVTISVDTPETTPVEADPPVTPAPLPPTPPPIAAPSNCDPAYPTVCIPPLPPDLDCGDIAYRRFTVLPPDPHKFDGSDNDGIGCES